MEDVNVVDDIDDELIEILDEKVNETHDGVQQDMPPPPVPELPARSKPPKLNPNPILGALTERTTRSSINPNSRNSSSKLKKLKLKLSDKVNVQAPTASFLGSYDRELDSDVDEEGSELLFEEHLILRML